MYGENAAKMHGFALTFTLNVFLANFDVNYVISMGLVSNAVAMFVMLEKELVYSLFTSYRWGFPGIFRTFQCYRYPPPRGHYISKRVRRSLLLAFVES